MLRNCSDQTQNPTLKSEFGKAKMTIGTDTIGTDTRGTDTKNIVRRMGSYFPNGDYSVTRT